MRFILLGAPGAGKGTQAKNISKKFNITHISTGDILRKEIKRKTDLGQKALEFVENGKLVPDSLIIDIIKKVINSNESGNGFLMDGFPRNLNQAKLFTKMLDKYGIGIDKVVNINIDKEEIINRLSKRMTCSNCHLITGLDNLNSKELKCPVCGSSLIKRKDDDTDVIKKRLEVYEKETKPLIEYYEKMGLLLNINGSGKVEDVSERILKSL